MTNKLADETAAYARDLVNAEFAGRAGSSAQQQQERERQVREDLMSEAVQTEAGQLTRTQERLTTYEDRDSRIFIDGRAELLARDQRRALAEAVVPADVQRQGFRQLDATSRQLTEMANRAAMLLAEEEELAKELERKRKSQVDVE